jgi:hypothetical protein
MNKKLKLWMTETQMKAADPRYWLESEWRITLRIPFGKEQSPRFRALTNIDPERRVKC